MEAYSLFEVNQYIKRVIALNFDEPLWVECEINQISQTRGNTYLDLIEKSESSDDIIAKSSATLWFRQASFIKKKLGKIVDDVLSPGVKVKLKCTLEFSERYGLSLNIQDIDPSYTFGQFEINRQKIIERLQKEDRLERNRDRELPLVIKKIAVISSSTAAGYKDFTEQLYNNSYSYRFEVELFEAAMQGQNTEREVLMALDSIDTSEFDMVCLIRGGGSKLDLSAFDNYAIAAKISDFNLPVITGIGHEIDQTICDIVAHTSLKTPTAVAGFIIEHNMNFEVELDYLLQEIRDRVWTLMNEQKQRLASISTQLSHVPRSIIQQKKSELGYLNDVAQQSVSNTVKTKKQQLEAMERMIELVNPRNILKRGFTLVKSGDSYITRKKQMNKTLDTVIEFYDGNWKIKE